MINGMSLANFTLEVMCGLNILIYITSISLLRNYNPLARVGLLSTLISALIRIICEAILAMSETLKLREVDMWTLAVLSMITCVTTLSLMYSFAYFAINNKRKISIPIYIISFVLYLLGEVTFASAIMHFEYGHKFVVFELPKWVFIAGFIACCAAMIMSFYMVISNIDYIGKARAIAIALYSAIPILALIISVFIPLTSLVDGVITLALGTIVVAVGLLRDRDLELNKHSLHQKELRLLNKQIRPHFIYNVMNSIYYLMDKDKDMAKDALYELTMLMRANTDIMWDDDDIVPFYKEFNLVHHALKLDQMRYGDRINVEVDIENEDFMIPTFTLEPLVENAVKHGLLKKRGGGTVRITECEVEDKHLIKVIDDGAGIDTSPVTLPPDKTHVGLENVKKRIESFHGASFIIYSPEEGGTVAEMCIPDIPGGRG